MKECTKCHIFKSLSDYYADPRCNPPVQPCCKSCFKERARQYRQSTQGKQKSRQYRSTEEFKEKNRLALRAYRRTEKFKHYWRKYVRTEKHRAYVRAYEKEYRKQPIPQEKDRLQCSEYRAKKLTSSDNTVTYSTTQNLLRKQKYLCNICHTNLKAIKKHLDHIYPISKGGKHTITNVQWLCYRCNIKKSNHV